MSSTGPARRRLALAVLCLGPVLVVCDIPAQQENHLVANYEMGFSCDDTANPAAEQVTVSGGGESSNSIARSCADTFPGPMQQPAAQSGTAGANLVTYSSQLSGRHFYLTCNYDLGPFLIHPATCGGEVAYELGYTPILNNNSGSGTDFGDNFLSFRVESMDAGVEPPGATAANVVVNCEFAPGDIAIALGETHTYTVKLPTPVLAQQQVTGYCSVRVAFAGTAIEPGLTSQRIVVTALTTSNRCKSTGECPSHQVCGPQGCQLGVETDPCKYPFVPAGNDGSGPSGHCSASAPFCSQQFNRCQDGSVGDLCSFDDECAAGLVCHPVSIFGFCGVP